MDLHSRPNVFVAQEQPRFNYSDAERFGDLVFVTAVDYSPHQSSLQNDRLLTAMRHAASRFNPVKDYLLLTGGPITMGLLFHHFSKKSEQMGITGVRCLQWDRVNNQYRQVIVRLK